MYTHVYNYISTLPVVTGPQFLALIVHQVIIFGILGRPLRNNITSW